MNIGNQILNIRKENQLTQEEFDKLFQIGKREKLSRIANSCKYKRSSLAI